MQEIDLDSLNINKYVNRELLKYYINGWGNAQICDSCGGVSLFGAYSHRLNCCGKETRLVLKKDNNEVKNKKIKPCPFCGGEGEFRDEGSMWVECQSCGAEGAWVDRHDGKTEDDAIDKWNIRV